MQKLKKNWFVVSKMTRKSCILTWAFESLKSLHFDWFLLCINLKNYWGVILNETEKWCKVWRKIDLWIGQWHVEFGKFSLEDLQVSKLELSWDFFAKVGNPWAKIFYRGVMKNDEKFEDELTCHFKIDMRNATNFDPSIGKSQKCSL